MSHGQRQYTLTTMAEQESQTLLVRIHRATLERLRIFVSRPGPPRWLMSEVVSTAVDEWLTRHEREEEK